MPRAELEDMARRYRNVYRRKNRALIHVLRWLKPGTVWAMDYADPPLPIDSTYRQVLVVRDLATGRQLMSLPAIQKAAEVTRDALLALFRQYGPPLVIKSDNDSTLTGEPVEALLQDWGIVHLMSPPGTPEYNGACEAGIGGLRTRAHYESARHGRPGEWTCDDVEAARLMANETARPQGKAGPTPDEAWRARTEGEADERRSLADSLERERREARAEHGGLPGIPLTPWMEASIERVAISRALVACNLLTFRRRRITLPIIRRSASNIT
jgi:transposase InsO family protein